MLPAQKPLHCYFVSLIDPGDPFLLGDPENGYNISDHNHCQKMPDSDSLWPGIVAWPSYLPTEFGIGPTLTALFHPNSERNLKAKRYRRIFLLHGAGLMRVAHRSGGTKTPLMPNPIRPCKSSWSKMLDCLKHKDEFARVAAQIANARGLGRSWESRVRFIELEGPLISTENIELAIRTWLAEKDPFLKSRDVCREISVSSAAGGLDQLWGMINFPWEQLVRLWEGHTEVKRFRETRCLRDEEGFVHAGANHLFAPAEPYRHVDYMRYLRMRSELGEHVFS